MYVRENRPLYVGRAKVLLFFFSPIKKGCLFLTQINDMVGFCQKPKKMFEFCVRKQLPLHSQFDNECKTKERN